MPTFRNDTEYYIDFDDFIIRNERREHVIVRFKPGEERKLDYWLPYVQAGLTLVDANNPPVPETILISSTYDFTEGLERRFNIPPCDRYIVNIIVQSGAIKFFTGASANYQEVSEDADVPFRYRTVLEWEAAPYIRLLCDKGEAKVTLNAEVLRATIPAQRTGDELTWR